MTDLSGLIGMFDKQLATVQHLLDKGEAQSGEDILTWRLADDMHPLSFQVRTAVNFARRWPARAIGAEPPPELTETLDLAGYRAQLADGRAELAAMTPDRFAGRDDTPITETLGNGLAPTLPARQWLTGFVASNIYFHVSMVYAILRARGVPIGKRDLFPAGL